MKFLASLLTATALLSSCVSAIPLAEDHILALRADNGDNGDNVDNVDNGKSVEKGKKPQTTQTTQTTDDTQPTSAASEDKEDYPIGRIFKNWMEIDHVKKRLKRACSTQGGSEGWTQFEFDDEFKTAFNIPDEHQVREVKVYNSGAADFVLPPTEQYNGMIMELKCENKNTNSGNKLGNLVDTDIKKEKELTPQYKRYTFRVLAMAWSDKAETALEDLGLKVIPGVRAPLKDEPKKDEDFIKMYQRTVSTGSADDDVDELTQGMENLNTDDKNEDKKTDTAKTGEANTGEAATGKTKTDDANTKGSKKASGEKESGEKGGKKGGKGSGKKGGKKGSGKKGGSGAGTSGTS